LLNTAYKEIRNNVDIIATTYKTASHAELVTACATLKVNLDLLRVFRNAKTNQELAEEALKNVEEE
jgi:predicted CoA-binding protein